MTNREEISERRLIDAAVSVDGKRKIAVMTLPGQKIHVTYRDAFGVHGEVFDRAEDALDCFDRLRG